LLDTTTEMVYKPILWQLTYGRTKAGCNVGLQLYAETFPRGSHSNIIKLQVPRWRY